MTVLVVEDDSNVLAFIDRMLTQNGHTVLAAEDPDQARFVLAEHGGKADVLLVDIVLPGSNGLDFARAAKERNPSRLPAVLRSGLGPVLRKPFTSEELLKTIDSL
jgi:two-component system OmpR family response regulator